MVIKTTDIDWKYILDVSIAAMCLTDSKGKFLRFNKKMQTLTGYSSNELENLNFSDIFKDHEDYNTTISDVQLKGKIREKIVYLKQKGQTPILTRVNMDLKSINDELILITSFIDIPDLDMPINLLERKKRDINETVRRFVDFSFLFDEIEQVNLFEIDVNGNFTTFSYEWGKMFGYTIDEAKNITNALQLIDPSDRKRVAANLQRVLPVVTTKDLEYLGLRKTAFGLENFPMLMYTRPIMHKNKIKGRRGILIDVSSSKKMEKEIKELNETLKIINTIITHDISNDLTVLNATIELYMLKQDSELLNGAIKTITKSASLIKRMKVLEHLVFKDMVQQIFVAKNIIDEVVSSYDFSELGIDVIIKGNTMILADLTITSVIDNLISNAVKYSKTKKIDIVIEDMSTYSLISIADYGIGIHDEYKKIIFEPGIKFGESQSTGLGLYIAYKNVERYGGKIWIEDNEPKGCVFKIKLKKPDSTLNPSF